jgi:predicted DNA-binding transcriptional regulator YafY
MAKKRTPPPQPPAPQPTPAERAGLTADRFARLYRLIRFLATGPKSRDRLTRHLHLDVRGFYRDLELLRSAGIGVTLTGGQYGLDDDPEAALARLPFPDPHLTLGEAQQLAKGRTQAHRHLQEQIQRITT